MSERLIWEEFPVGDSRTSCPSCGRGKRDKTMGVSIEHSGNGVAHCFRCGHVETYRPQAGATQWRHIPAVQPVATKHQTLSAWGKKLWSECQPLQGTVGESYLKNRHCVVPPGDLRFHPALEHKPSGYTGPALVGLVTDAISSEPISLHRTWIEADGRKADIDPPRLLLGNHRKQGGVIRLWPDEYVSHGLAVTEGVETALSLAHAFEPVWACIDAGNLAAFPHLSGIECLLIGADNDQAGIAAANQCAQRWTTAGADVLISQQAANDLNDALMEAA